MSSDEEDNVDILALITGSGSVPKTSRIPPLTRPLSTSSDDEDFSLVLPPVFQTDGVKNDILAKRNRDLAHQMESEKIKFDSEYNHLVQNQLQILQMLNDNGSQGHIVFLLEKHQDLINGLVKQAIRGGGPKKHFYFYAPLQLIPEQDISAGEYTPNNGIHQKDLQNNIIDIDVSINSTDPLLVLKFLNHLENCRNTIKEADIDLSTFKKLLSTIGGSVSNPVGLKMAYFNLQGYLTVLKASILMHLVCLQPFEPLLMGWALEWAILSLADFFILKNNFVEYVKHYLRALERFFQWSYSAMGRVELVTQVLENHLANSDIEVASNFLQLTFRYYFNDKRNTAGYTILLKAIERFTLGNLENDGHGFEAECSNDNDNTKNDNNNINHDNQDVFQEGKFIKAVSELLLQTDLESCQNAKHRIMLLPLLVTSSDQSLLPILSESRNLAHRRLGELSNGSGKLRNKSTSLEDISSIYDTLDFLVQKIERQALPMDLFYHE